MQIPDATLTVEHRSNAPHHLYLTLAAIAVGILAVGVGWALYELVLIERNVNLSAASTADVTALVKKSLQGTHKNGDDGLLVLSKVFMQNADQAANALKQTMQDANTIAKAEEPKSVALANSSIALLDAGKDDLTKLGTAADQLSSLVLWTRTSSVPKLEAGLDSLNGLVSDLRPTAKASTELVEELTDTIGTVKVTVGTANELLADPELGQMVHSLNLAAENANGTLAGTKLVTLDVHNMLNPKKPTFWEGLAELAARSVVGQAAGPLISHFWPLGINVKNTVSVTPAK